jgi:hypothetical protein
MGHSEAISLERVEVECSGAKWFGERGKGTAAVMLVAEARGQFGNPEKGERPPLEAVTRQRLVKTQQTKKTSFVL